MGALAYDRDEILDRAEFLSRCPDMMVFDSLRWWCHHLPHDEMIALVNEAGLTTAQAAMIARAWSLEHGFLVTFLEFESAFCGGGHPGEILSYRQTKNTWGRLVAIHDSTGRPSGARGEGRLRLWFTLKENNSLRLKQQTRNELKAVLGRDHRLLVNDALRSSKRDFLEQLTPGDAGHILRSAKLSPDAFWRSVKNGDAELVARLGLIPSDDRERMRKRGMYVAPSLQLALSL